jgi:hypothetical protein
MNYGNLVTQLAILGRSEIVEVQYPAFENFGIILNIQGYPGGIQVSESEFINNMIYINEVYPSMRGPFDVAESIDLYMMPGRDKISLTRCEASTGTVKRLMTNYLTSLIETPVDLFS